MLGSAFSYVYVYGAFIAIAGGACSIMPTSGQISPISYSGDRPPGGAKATVLSPSA